jgi:hypothetical protein
MQFEGFGEVLSLGARAISALGDTSGSVVSTSVLGEPAPSAPATGRAATEYSALAFATAIPTRRGVSGPVWHAISASQDTTASPARPNVSAPQRARAQTEFLGTVRASAKTAGFLRFVTFATPIFRFAQTPLLVPGHLVPIATATETAPACLAL